MSSLTRMLAILDEFTVSLSVLSAEDIMSRLSYSRGTAYRYLRELTAAGLLTSVGGAYALGPRIIELDFSIRSSDPYIKIVQPIMRSLSDRLDCDILMSSYYQGRVIVRHHERGNEEFTMSYGRGRRMPLFLGAPSKIILASLPKSKLQKLFEDNIEQLSGSEFSDDWDEFYKQIKRIRRQGFALSRGELDEGNVGVSAPLKTDPPSSLTFVFSRTRFEIADEKRVGEIILSASEQANSLIAQMESGADNPVQWLDTSKRAG